MEKKLVYYGVGAIALSLISFGIGVAVTNKPVPKLEDGKEIVATIKGKEFTAQDLYAQMKKETGTSTLITAVDDFISEKEIKVTAELINVAKDQVKTYKNNVTSQGGVWENQLADWGFKNEKEMEDFLLKEEKKAEVVRNFIEKKLTDKQIEQYYDKEIYGEITARHILITPDATEKSSEEEKTKAKNEAKKLAEDIITKLDKGEKWEDLVKKYSEDTGTKDKNGELTFKKNDVVEPFFNAALKLKNNEYTKEPVESEFGYHIILKVNQAKKPTLEVEKENIKDTLVELELKKDGAYDKAWLEIRKSYDFVIKDDDINKLYKTISSQI